MLEKFYLALLILCVLSMASPKSVVAQEKGATIRGKIAQPETEDFKIPMDELNIRLVQQVKLPEPPLPKDWKDLSVKQRKVWVEQFKETELGKKFVADNEAILKNARNFELTLEKDGSFAVYDVPFGKFDLRGRVDKKLKDRNFAFEVFGELTVLKDIDELVLDPITIMVTPLLQVGEIAPAFDVKTHNDTANLVPEQFRGNYVFLNFWSTESPPSVEFQKDIQKMYTQLKDKHPLELLSVCIDSDRKIAVNHIVKSKLKGRHGFTDGWDHPTVEAFGIRAIPSQWLIDPEGKILMTHMDFRRAFQADKSDLTTIVNDRIEGRDSPDE